MEERVGRRRRVGVEEVTARDVRKGEKRRKRVGVKGEAERR